MSDTFLPPESSAKPVLFNTLQAGRCVAAMAVMVHHAAISIEAFVEVPPRIVRSIFEYGYLGVDFFFVLSGFIIHYSMTVNPRGASEFAADRFFRIMIPYLPVGILVALVYTYVPRLSASEREWSWLSSLTLFPTSESPALSVAWTLQHEMLFYFLYAVLFFFNRLFLGMAVWFFGIIVFNTLFSVEANFSKILFSPLNLEFLAGLLAAIFVVSKRRVNKPMVCLLSASLVLVFIFAGGGRSESYILGFGLAFLLPVVCEIELGKGLSVPKWFILGGAASYALYLTHNPLLSVLSRVFSKLDLGWESAFVASFLLCVLMGLVYFWVWERRMMRLTKEIRSNGNNFLPAKGVK